MTTGAVPARASQTVGADRAGAVDDLEAAYLAYYDGLIRYARWLVGDPCTAADVVQEAYVRLAARFVGVRDPRSYLFQIVTNLVRTEWRRRKREPVLAEVDTGADPAEAVAVRAAVLGLPKREREVIVLRYYADLDVAEIARVTGRPEGTVKSQLFTARQRLARALEERRDRP